MVQLSYLAGTVIMGALVVVIGLGVTSRSQQRSRSARSEGGNSLAHWLQGASNDPTVWMLVFFGLVTTSVGGALLFATDLSVPGVPASFGAALVGLMLGSVLAYLCWGAYDATRQRGLHKPAAIAVALWTAGLLFVSLVTLRLLEIQLF